VLNVLNVTMTTVNKLLERSLRSTSPLDLSLGYSAANFPVLQILAHEDAKAQLFVVNDELRTMLLKSEGLVVNLDSE